jgi:transcriptional regulator with XRE-family HTH domain
MYIGQKLIDLRGRRTITRGGKVRKMSQAHLARLVGVDVQTVSRWERNKVQPETPQLESLSGVLGVTLDYWQSGLAAARPSAREITAKITELALAAAHGSAAARTELERYGELLLDAEGMHPPAEQQPSSRPARKSGGRRTR